MSITILIYTLIVLIFLLFVVEHFRRRNQKVHQFRTFLIELFINYVSHSEDATFWRHYDKISSYHRMIFSFKKLHIENYLSAEVIEELSKIPENKKFIIP